MASHMVDSVLFKDQFGTEEMRRIFDDRNLLQRWMDVEAALARAEAAVGLIPDSAAEEISRRCEADLLDVEAIKRGIDETSHPIVPFLHAYQAVCGKEAGEYLHWGATTQDIIDSGMVLQIREAYDESLDVLLNALSSEVLNHKGDRFRYTNFPMELRPVQHPHPPLWYGAGSLGSAEWSAKMKPIS